MKIKFAQRKFLPAHYWASGTAGSCDFGAGAGFCPGSVLPGPSVGTAGEAGAVGDCSGAAFLASEVSILVGTRVTPAIAAITTERMMNVPPRMEVDRVRKSA